MVSWPQKALFKGILKMEKEHPQNRKLGWVEGIFKDTVVVTEVELSGELDRTIFARAIALMLARNPILSCRMVKRGGDYYFEHQNSPENIITEINVDSDERLQHFVAEALQKKFADGDKAFHCYLLRWPANSRFTLLAHFSHAIYDGVSLSSFIRGLCLAYEEIAADRVQGVAPLITPRLEDYPQAKISFKDIKYYINKTRAASGGGRSFLPIHQEAPREQRLTRSVYEAISPDLTERLIKASRKQRTTFHGVIMAAMYYAMLPHLAHKEQPFILGNNIDLRPLNEIPTALMGPYITLVTQKIPFSESSGFWQIAKATRQDISLDMIHKFPIITDRIEAFLTRILPRQIIKKLEKSGHMGRVFNLCISNLGSLEAPEQFAGIRVEKIVSHVAIENRGPDLLMTVIYFRERLSFNLIYAAPLIETKLAETIMADFIGLLNKAVN
jgi:NRPS condensation-like uncharacterized protein